jgi:hypothetical protein
LPSTLGSTIEASRVYLLGHFRKFFEPTAWKHVRRWILGTFCLVISIVVAFSFISALRSALEERDAAQLSCTYGPGIVNNALTYVEIELLDQHPIEPYFNATIFVNLGNAVTDLKRVTFTRSAGRSFAQSTVDVDLVSNPDIKALWGTKRVNFDIVRVTGAHRDFPFDSAKFDFDLKYSPAGLPINNVFLRNRNPGFDLDCTTYKAERLGSDRFHIAFEARRNPLVQLTAKVLVGAGLFFLLGIVVFVKQEALPTSIASFFSHSGQFVPF